MLVNFITNIPRDSFSGGVSAVNRAALEALETFAEIHYVGPVSPPVSSCARAASKFLRLAGYSGAFPAFSNTRLKRIAETTHKLAKANAAFDFFTGVTSWSRFNSTRPRLAWTDCSFRDYIRICHNGRNFRHADINRISGAELAWIRGARAVLMTSHWARERLRREIPESAERLRWVGIFGNEDPTCSPEYKGGKDLLFVSTDFRAKGGFDTLSALSILRQEFPSVRLTIIGDAPKEGLMEQSGVSYLGYLSKSDPHQRERYRRSLAEAFALVLPTQADIAPLTPLEAACFGTPTVSVRTFAIPEMIGNENGGILLDPPTPPHAIAAALRGLMTDQPRYLSMRRQVQSRFQERFSRNQFQQRLIDAIKACGLS